MTHSLVELDVTAVGPDQLSYRLVHHGPAVNMIGPGLMRWQVTIQRRAEDALCKKMAAAVIAEIENPTDRAEPKLIKLGRALYNLRVPATLPDLRQALRSIDVPLLITADDDGMLWELMYDDEGGGFLGIIRAIGRSLKTDARIANPNMCVDRRCLLIINPSAANTEGNLKAAAEEGPVLRRWLTQHGVTCREYLEGEAATFDNVVTQLAQNRYQFIHYAGHMEPDNNGEPVMIFSDGESLRGATLANVAAGVPHIFLGACGSSTGGSVTGKTPRSATSESFTFSRGIGQFTSALIHAGARTVVGTLFSAPDAGARVVAETFYEPLLEGEPAGEALRKARVAAKSKTSNGPAWACFVLYGDPTTVLASLDGPPPPPPRRSVLQSLLLAQRIVRATNADGMSSIHLFCGMLAIEGGPLEAAFRRFGISSQSVLKDFLHLFDLEGIPPGPDDLWDLTVPLSETVSQTLFLADAYRQNHAIDEFYLLDAFVQQGGGKIGKLLDEYGMSLPMLVSKLIRDDGWIDFSRFDEAAMSALYEARRAARLKGYVHIGRRHLLYGLLTNENGYLAGKLREYGRVSSTVVAESIWASMQVDSFSATSTDLRLGDCSTGLMRVLCFAEQEVHTQRGGLVTEQALAMAALRDPGNMGQILSLFGVPWSTFLSE